MQRGFRTDEYGVQHPLQPTRCRISKSSSEYPEQCRPRAEWPGPLQPTKVPLTALPAHGSLGKYHVQMRKFDCRDADAALDAAMQGRAAPPAAHQVPPAGNGGGLCMRGMWKGCSQPWRSLDCKK